MLSRRKTILKGIECSVGLLLAKDLYAKEIIFPAKEQMVIIGGLAVNLKTNVPSIKEKDATYDCSLIVFNESTKLVRSIKLPFAPHSILLHPIKQTSVFAIPNDPDVKEVLEVDLQTEKITGVVTSSNGSPYYGHGLIDEKRSRIILVEFANSGDSKLIVRDLATLKEVGKINCPGQFPHEIVMLDGKYDDCALICCSQTASIINLDTGNVRLSLPMTEANQKFGHALKIPGGRSMLLGNVSGKDPKTNPANIFIFDQDTTKTLSPTRPIFGEALSSALHLPSMILAVTHQHADVVSIWNLRSGSCLSILDIPKQPRGIVVTEEGRFLVNNILGQIFEFFANKHTSVTQLPAARYLTNSSHILRTMLSI